MNSEQSEEDLTANLKDADCPCEMVEKIIKCHNEGDVAKELRLLSRQRCTLLEEIHEKQKKLDCLDYLIYRLKKTQGENNKSKTGKDKR